LILLQVDERDGQLGEVGDVVVEQLGCLEHAGVEAAVADPRDVRVVRRRNKLLQIREPSRTNKSHWEQLLKGVFTPEFSAG
jgi:hypothetical protein